LLLGVGLSRIKALVTSGTELEARGTALDLALTSDAADVADVGLKSEKSDHPYET